MQKTVLITGATSGLGRAVAMRLAAEGHRVIATGRDTEKLNQLKGVLPNLYLVHRLNVAFEPEFETLSRELKEIGINAIDTIFVNASVHLEHAHLYPDTPYERWPHERIRMRTMCANYFGAVRTFRTFLPHVLRSDEGRIVITSGTVGSFFWHHHPEPSHRAAIGIQQPAYAASKAAINMEMLNLARQQLKLFVVSLHPGWLETAIGGTGSDGMRPRKVETALKHVNKYLVGEIDRTRSGEFIGPGDKKIEW